jgi:hypothetical protein
LKKKPQTIEQEEPLVGLFWCKIDNNAYSMIHDYKVMPVLCNHCDDWYVPKVDHIDYWEGTKRWLPPPYNTMEYKDNPRGEVHLHIEEGLAQVLCGEWAFSDTRLQKVIPQFAKFIQKEFNLHKIKVFYIYDFEDLFI